MTQTDAWSRRLRNMNCRSVGSVPYPTSLDAFWVKKDARAWTERFSKQNSFRLLLEQTGKVTFSWKKSDPCTLHIMLESQQLSGQQQHLRNRTLRSAMLSTVSTGVMTTPVDWPVLVTPSMLQHSNWLETRARSCTSIRGTFFRKATMSSATMVP